MIRPGEISSMGEPFREAIGRVLHDEWDPIGISDDPEAGGEYGFIDEIQVMLVRREPRDRLVDHLVRIVTGRMSLSGDRGHDGSVADRLIGLRNAMMADA